LDSMDVSQLNLILQDTSTRLDKLETLLAHNKYRSIHKAPKLIFDEQLNKEAEIYAKQLSKRGTLEHTKSTLYGENLAMKCMAPQEQEPSGQFFTTLWYEEVCNPGYNFDNGQFSMPTGHFSQVIWKDTKQLGIGKAISIREGIRCLYVVARYKPPGNYQGEFEKNVLKGDFDSSICESINSKRTSTPRYFSKKQKSKYGTWIL